jgi:hypothetical protein
MPDTVDDLADLSLFASGSKPFILSHLSTIFNAVRVYLKPWEDGRRFLASVRLSDTILRSQKLSVVELALIAAHFITFTQQTPSVRLQELVFKEASTKLRDGNVFFPHLYDDAVLLDIFDLFNSFPSVICNLVWQNDQR